MEKEKNKISLLIDKSTDLLRSAVDTLAGNLALFLIGWFTAKLIVKDGKIVNSKENFEVLNELEQQKQSFFKSSVIPFLSGIALVFFKISEANKKYFNQVEDEADDNPDGDGKDGGKKNPIECVKGVQDTVRAQFGFNVNDKDISIDPNGWLAAIGDMKDVYTRVRETAMRAISVSMPLSEFLKVLALEIKGDDRINGLLASHFRTIVWDVYAEFNRQVGFKTAVCLGYRSAVYEAGLIETSRDFCIERNGKVFTFEEIEKFGTSDDAFGGYTDKSSGSFKGKTKFDYNPFFDQGGYNCRHSYSFIPDRLAIRLRPELKDVFNARTK